jgi:nucleoside-diphosphate-sugar epimerase
MKPPELESSPASVPNVEALEELLSCPSEGLVATFRRVPGDFVILGVGGKMGPSLARMARRASDAAGSTRRIIGVSRFSDPVLPAQLRSHGVETIQTDLLDEAQLAKLPDAPNVIFMTGMKFGSTGREALTWAMNVHLPSLICRRYPRSRIVAFSTGNIYGLAPVSGGGSLETDTLNPVGEYAMSCLGRERMFEYCSRHANIPVSLIRLNYASELRYGVLVDVAERILAGQPIELAMGYFNTIWLADANEMALRSLEHASWPPLVLNVAGPELLSVSEIGRQLAKLMGKPAIFTGEEYPTALLSNARKSFGLFGKPRITAEQLIRWTADWVARRQPLLGKPTHFESREGKF